MPGFLKGEVPNPNYEREDVNQFSQISEFTNDVYVYGTLYADIFAKDIDFGDEVEFFDLKVKNNFSVGGISTFYGPVNMDYLTVYQQLNVGAIGTVFVAISSTSEENGLVSGTVGIGTTQPNNKFQVGVDNISFNITESGAVGIGTTQPIGKFQIAHDCIVVTDDCDVGIGTTQPVDKVQINVGDDSFVVTGIGTVGIGTTSVGGDWTVGNVNYDGSTQGELKLDILGSVHVDRNIYDSQGSPGVNGYYLQRDQNGIRWNQVSPADLDGIRVQDEGTDLPIGGTSQLYSHLNFVQVNSLGTGVDNLIPIPNPQNPTTIANIQTKDFWGHNGNNIYRMSNVGINNNNPTSTLDITGTVHATGAVDFDSTLNVDGATTLNSTLDVDGGTTLNNILDVDGATTLNSTLDVDGDTTLNATLDVDGGTTLNNTLDVDGLTTFNNGTDATSTTNASVQIDGGVGIVKKLIVGDQTKIESTIDSTDKDTGALIVEGGVGIEKNLNVGVDAVIKGRLDVDDTTNSSSPTTGSAVIDGGVGIGLNLNVGGSGVIEGRLDVNDVTQSTNLSLIHI